ncbi:MAG: SpoIIE family protein phosphatase [Candidatus Sulfomarinibacteraceae bacterium]
MMLRKVFVLGIVLAQVVVFGSLIVWRVLDWKDLGWAGLSYNIDTEVERERPIPAFFWAADSRRVEMVAPGGPADRVGVEAGDRVVSVDGIEIADLDGLREVAARSRSGDTLRYRVEGPAGPRWIDLRLEDPYRNPLFIAGTATSVFAGAVFLAISMLVYWSRPQSQVAMVFFLMCVFGAAEYLVWAVIEFDLPTMRGITPTLVEPSVFAGLMVVGFFAVALVNALLHLSLIFPRVRPVVERRPKIFVWIHVSPFLPVLVVLSMIGAAVVSRTVVGTVVAGSVIALAIPALVLRFRRLASGLGALKVIGSHPWTVFGLAVLLGGLAGLSLRLVSRSVASVVMSISFAGGFLLCMLFILVYSVLTVVALYRSYRESGTDEQQQVRWPLWGTATAVGSSVVLMIVSFVLQLVFGDGGHVDFASTVALSTVSKMVYLLIPVSLAFGIVKYRLMDIDLIIRKTVIYTAVTGFVVVVYLILAGMSGLALVRSAGLESQAATVVATLLVVALFVPVKNRIQRLVDRVFFQREQDTEASIARLAKTVAESVSMEGMSLAVAEELQRTLRCRSVAVLVRRAASDHLAVEATVGLPETAVSGLLIPTAASILRTTGVHVVKGRDEWTEEEGRVFAQTDAERAVIGRRGDEALALITLGRKLNREPFDDEDEVYLEAVAGQLAVGVGRLRGRRAELEFAQALQIPKSLLPSEVPQIDGVEAVARWRPAREVSGDYYDVLQLDERRLAVCIGDVVGKGMPAALLMSSLQAAVKAVAVGDADPAKVCTQVRSVVTSNLSGGRFVTFFFAVLDRGTSMLRFANCGHNQPVLVRGDGTVLRLDRGGPAFARLMRDLPYEAGAAPLEPGDRLVLFTDGVSEAMDGAGKQFGEDRIVELVTRHRAAAAGELEAVITRAVLDHAGGELQDDLTLVVVAVG